MKKQRILSLFACCYLMIELTCLKLCSSLHFVLPKFYCIRLSIAHSGNANRR